MAPFSSILGADLCDREGPKETNYFLETRLNSVAPVRSEFKPPPILLSRKGPIKQSRRPPTDGINNLNLQCASSSDEEETDKKALTAEERKAQAAKEREEKQRKYEERRQELFGSAGTANAATSVNTNSSLNVSNGNSGSSTPRNTTPTPPGSRSATPNRSRGRGGKRGGAPGLTKEAQQKREKDLFDPSYSAKPDSIYLQRREKGLPEGTEGEVKPIRSPKGPDGSGRGGFGFAPRGGKPVTTTRPLETA